MISRKDRQQGRGGGVCIYLSQHLHLKRRADLECPDMECMWLWLRPTRLPRALTGIVVGVVYSPSDRNVEEGERLCGHITSTIDTIRYRNPDAGVVILGDFNNLNIRNLMFSQNLKQAVQQPTRGNAILDLIVTNLHCFYQSPNVSAPLGSSDHNSIVWLPDRCNNVINNNKGVERFIRHFPKSGMRGFGSWAAGHSWFHSLGPTPTVDDLVQSFTSDVRGAMDNRLPQKAIKCHPTDKPWITPDIKDLIKLRQRAFHSGNINLWKHYRYKVRTWALVIAGSGGSLLTKL